MPSFCGGEYSFRMSPMAQKRTSRPRLVPIQPMVPSNSVKGPPANDVSGPFGSRSIRTLTSACSHTQNRADGSNDCDQIATLAEARIHTGADTRIHTGMPRTAGTFHSWTRSTHAGTRGDAPCDEHPLRSLQ